MYFECRQLKMCLELLVIAGGIMCLGVEGNCYCVSPENGRDKCGVCPDRECYPLSYYVNNTSLLINNTAFIFLPGEHHLYNVWKFTSLKNITLVSSCNGSTPFETSANIACGNSVESGLLFENVSDLTIAGLRFFHCGNISNDNETKHMGSALLLLNVSNLTMSWVEIHDSIGWGMYCFLLLGDSVISHTIISNGHYSGNKSGGNMRLKYVDYDYDNRNHTLLVSYSVIKGGRENPKDYKAYAGGIDIYLKTRRRVHIKFQLVTLENNSGYDGGNVAITYTTLHDGWNSSVTFISCNFSRGTAAHRGGGIFFEAMLKNRQPLNSPHNQLVLEVTHSVFTENKAKTVGGGMYLQVHENQNLTALAEANFTNCNFTGNIVTRPNSAQGGFAAHVVNFKLPGSVPHHLPQYGITFAECLFQYNGPSVRNPSSLGCGVLYISENGRTILKNVNISHNNCTGLAAAQSTVEIYGNITIHNNTGFNGGGVLLCANSVMFITKGVQMSITNNQAQNYGGGIYAEFECSQAIAPCFYGTETKNKSVFLVNNGAKKAGDAIYGGSIDHCFTASNSVLENGTNRVPFDDLFSVNQSSKSLSVISSDPSQVCFCDSKEFNTSNCTPLYYYPNDVYPGAVIKVHVVIVGQRNGTAPGVVGASFNQNSSAKIYISEFEKSKTIDSVACQELRYSISINDTNIQTIEEYNLSLSVENGYFQTLSPNRYTPAFINFYVKPCPYGFEMSDSKCHCTDALKNMLHGIECYISSQLFTRPGNAEWWMGFDNGSTLIFSQYCPFDYCRQSVKDIYLNDESHECAFKRTGILCGRCSKGLSNVFGSSKCTDCRSYTLWKTLGLTLLFAIVGFILLLLVGLLNLNVAEGAINPVLFYVNVVRINHSLFFDSCKNNSFCVEKFLGVFVAWMNLDLELDTCYYHGMTVIGKTAIQFVFPFYLWILTGLIIYFSRRCALVSRVAGKNSVRLLATIILLSYAKLIRTVIDVMWQSKLFQLSNTHTIFYGSVWKMDGNVPYFGKEHGYLSLFAGLVAVITLPYTFVLLFIKCLKRMSHFRALFWVIKWKPFFDAYTGPYRDKYHFWPGFLLLVRIFLFVAIASNVSKGPILNLTLVCTTASILFLLNQPGVYKTWFLSVIESFTYFNLVLFSIGTAYVLQQNSKDDTAGDYPKEKTVCLCVGSMFLLFCGIVAWNLFHIVGGTDYWGQVKVWLQEKKWPWRKRKTVRPLVLRHSVTDSLSSSSSEDELDPILQNAPPVARYDKLREPLVETN